MSKGDKPTPPDPTQSADAQQTLNVNTGIANANLGHVNQNTPYGSLSWQQTGTNPDGTPQYTSTSSLSPAQQQLWQGQLSQDAGMQAYQNHLLGNMGNSYGMDPSQFNQLQTSAGAATSAGPSAQYAAGGIDAGQAGASQANGWDIQSGLQTQDLQGAFDQQQQAAYGNQMGYLQPNFDKQRAQTVNQLSQQGITQQSNPAAYEQAMEEMNRQQTFQQQQAYGSSYQQGLAGANQLFNQDLQSGQFYNQAQNQGFGQSLANATQQNASDIANAGYTTQANVAAGGNQTQAGIASMNAANNMGQFNAGQSNNMAQYNASLNNQANQQQWGNYWNTQNQPINMYNATRGTTSVQNPQFGNYGQGNMTSPNLMGAQQNAYNSQLASYNNEQSGMFGLGSAGLMTAAAYFM